MKKKFGISTIIIFFIFPNNVFCGKGFMGGSGDVTVQNLIQPVVESENTESSIPETVTGPINDKKSSSGQLFGDLYKLLRYQGSEASKMIPESKDGMPVCRSAVGAVVPCGSGKQYLVTGPAPVGGEPILSSGYGMYSKEVTNSDGTISYVLAEAPYPSQCVQPIANYDKWGNIGRFGNTIPLIMLYDATWGRTECTVGELVSATVDSSTGELINVIDEYFIEPGGIYDGKKYCEGIKWIDLVQEVDFGRLNLSRSPEAVLQAAFDEAINAINNATKIKLDAAGRLFLTTTVLSETETIVDPATGCTLPKTEIVEKAIDSPLENLALYVKLMKDGHLITAGDERAPIDRSEIGGIPLWKLLELTDGPSTALRPTVDIDKLKNPEVVGSDKIAVFAELVNANNISSYYTYYQCYTVDGANVPCMCPITQPDGTVKTGMCPDVAARKLIAAINCPSNTTCEYTAKGIPSDIQTPIFSENDLKFAAAFLAAAADKTGAISADMVVYINSILGINKVIGYSAYDDEGNPTPDAVNYSLNPIYFNFKWVTPKYYYDRVGTMSSRGMVTVLQQAEPGEPWVEKPVPITTDYIPFRNLMLDRNTYLPPVSREPAQEDISGFTQMADDNLGVIKFIHTYQIPSLR